MVSISAQLSPSALPSLSVAQRAAMTPEELASTEAGDAAYRQSLQASADARSTPLGPGIAATLVTRSFKSDGTSEAPSIDLANLQKVKTVETHSANYTNVQSIDPSSLADQISYFADMVARNEFQGMSFSGGNGTEQTDSPLVYLNWMKAAQASNSAGDNFTTYA